MESGARLPAIERRLEAIQLQADYDRAYAAGLSTDLAALRRDLVRERTVRAGRSWWRYTSTLASLAAVFVGCWWISPSLALIVLGVVFAADALLAGWIQTTRGNRRKRPR